MVSRRFTSRELSGRSSFGIKLQIVLTPCLREVCTAFFFSRLSNFFWWLIPIPLCSKLWSIMWNWFFFCLSVFWNYYACAYSLFDNSSHTVCEKMAIHSLVCLRRSLLLTTCSGIVQPSSTIWQFFLLDCQKTIKIDAWALAQTGLHFHEGVEKIKENLQNWQEKYGGKKCVQLGQKLKNIYNFFKF